MFGGNKSKLTYTAFVYRFGTQRDECSHYSSQHKQEDGEI
jgi:hypothetical protein